MEALYAAASCSLMVVLALGALAWFALTGRTVVRGSDGSHDVTAELAALRAEVSVLRQGRATAEPPAGAS